MKIGDKYIKFWRQKSESLETFMKILISGDFYVVWRQKYYVQETEIRGRASISQGQMTGPWDLKKGPKILENLEKLCKILKNSGKIVQNQNCAKSWKIVQNLETFCKIKKKWDPGKKF